MLCWTSSKMEASDWSKFVCYTYTQQPYLKVIERKYNLMPHSIILAPPSLHLPLVLTKRLKSVARLFMTIQKTRLVQQLSATRGGPLWTVFCWNIKPFEPFFVRSSVSAPSATVGTLSSRAAGPSCQQPQQEWRCGDGTKHWLAATILSIFKE